MFIEETKVMTDKELESICGGDVAGEVINTGAAALAGGAIGAGLCAATGVGVVWAPACAYAGAKFGGAAYLIGRFWPGN